MQESRPTKESDFYALGMVVYEVLSGLKPFSGIRAPAVIISDVLKGKPPGRPQGELGGRFPDAVWRMLELCLMAQPSERTTSKAVLLTLEGSPPSLWPISRTADECVETGIDDWRSDAPASMPGTFPSARLEPIPNFTCDL